MILRETREQARQLRTDANNAFDAVRLGGWAMRDAGDAISKASVLIGTVAVLALGVALFTLHLLLNRTDSTADG